MKSFRNWPRFWRYTAIMIVAGLGIYALKLLITGIFPNEDKRVRTAFREFVIEQFPEAAAQTAAQYQLFLAENDGLQPLPAKLPARIVVLVHGLDEPGKVWRSLTPALNAAGWTTCEMVYPNDGPIRESTALLVRELGRLPPLGVERIILVGHSMGGLVSRELLTSPQIDYAGWKADGALPKVDALYMVGTPNHGSELARLRGFMEWRDHFEELLNGDRHILAPIFDGTGEAGIDLVPSSDFMRELNDREHPPGIDLRVVTGIASPFTAEKLDALRDTLPENAIDSAGEILDGLAAGIGDGCVTLESARLDGVPFVTVEGTHLSAIRNILEDSDRKPPAVPIVLKWISDLWGESGNP